MKENEPIDLTEIRRGKLLVERFRLRARLTEIDGELARLSTGIIPVRERPPFPPFRLPEPS